MSAPLRSISPGLPPEECSTLGNGLRVVLQADDRLPLVAMQMSYAAGSRHEPAGRWGLAHLAEHLLYTSNGRGPGFAERFHRLAARPSATTSFDRTRYCALLPSHRLAEGLAIEAERARAAAGGSDWAEAIATQRRVLCTERRQRLSSRPRGRAFEHLHRLLFPPRHPYRRPPAGLTCGIRASTHEDVTAFLRRHYRASQGVLVLLGNLPAETARWVEKTFGSLPPGSALPSPDSLDGRGGGEPSRRRPSGNRQRRTVIGSGDGVARAYLAYRLDGFGSSAWYAASLLASCLAVGRTSPLRRALVEQAGLARQVGAALVPMRDASTLVFSAEAAPGTDPERLTDALVDTLDRLSSREVDPSDLQRARKKTLADHYVEIQLLERRADLAARLAQFRDRPHRLASESRRYAAIDAAALRTFAARWCRPEDRVVSTQAPRGEAA